MTWQDAGFPNIELRPWGKVLYALFLGMKELAAAMGYDMTKYIIDTGRYGDTYYLDQISLADYSKGYYGASDPYRNMPSGMAGQFDYWFLQLLYQSFRAKYAFDHLEYAPDDAQTLSEINTFLGEELITGSTGQYFDLTAGFWTAWAKQRYRLIRNMPIYSSFDPAQSFAYRMGQYFTVDFKQGEWNRTISLSNTWHNGGYWTSDHDYGYTADINSSYFPDHYLESTSASRLQDPAYPFKIRFVHRNHIYGGFDFGTGLAEGQVWTEEINGFSNLTYSYTLPTDQDKHDISQNTMTYIQALPQNNPWITGGQ